MFAMIQRGVLGLLGLLALAVLAFNTFGIEPAVRLALSRVQDRTGTRATFGSARGNVLTGSLSIEDLHLVREVEGRNQFDLRSGHVTIDMSVLRAFEPSWRFDELSVVGTRGKFTTVARPPGKAGRLEAGSLFSVGTLRVQGVELEMTNLRDSETPITMEVEVKSLVTKEYRSAWSLYDILFRSTIDGLIDGRTFEVAGEDAEDARVVTWNLEAFPAGKWTPSLTGPLSLARSGRFDGKIVSRWPLHDPRTITQDYTIVFSEVNADPQPGANLLQNTMVPMIMSWFARQSGDNPIRFQIELERGRFEGAQSLADAGLYEAISEKGGDVVMEAASSGIRKELGEFGDAMRGLFGR